MDETLGAAYVMSCIACLHHCSRPLSGDYAARLGHEATAGASGGADADGAESIDSVMHASVYAGPSPVIIGVDSVI